MLLFNDNLVSQKASVNDCLNTYHVIVQQIYKE